MVLTGGGVVFYMGGVVFYGFYVLFALPASHFTLEKPPHPDK